MEPEEAMLMGRSQINRQIRDQKIINASDEAELQQSTAYIDFDSATGLARLRDTNGNIFYGKAQTNGAISKGENIRLRRGRLINSYDKTPTLQSKVNPSSTKQIVYSLPILFSEPEYYDIYRLDINYKSYVGGLARIPSQFGNSDYLAMACQIYNRILYYPVPKGVVPEFHLAPPDWREYDYYVFSNLTELWLQYGGEYKTTPGTDNNYFNYQNFYLRFTGTEYLNYSLDVDGFAIVEPLIGGGARFFGQLYS